MDLLHLVNLVISFRKSRSSRYPFAVTMARSFPSYVEEEEGQGIVHSVAVGDELREHKVFTAVLRLLKVVADWESCTVTWKGNKVPISLARQLLHIGDCYHRQHRATRREHYCNGYDHRDRPMFFGCRQLTAVNRIFPRNGEERSSENAWYQFGEVVDGVFEVDKEAISKRLTSQAEQTLTCACPAFRGDEVLHEVERLPTRIDPSKDTKWTIDTPPDGVQTLRLKTPQDKEAELQANFESQVESLPEPRASSGRKIPEVRFSDVCGQSKAVEAVRDWVELPVKHPDYFENLGLSPAVGILLYGPPGTGKTLLAKAVAGECNAHFEVIEGPEILSKWVGESESRIREIFARARDLAPSVVLFDEIDAVAPARHGLSHNHDITLSAQILAVLDGLYERGNVTLIATTNRPEAVDPALRRPGRLDFFLEMKLPDEPGRRDIFQNHLGRMSVSRSVDCDGLANITEGLSGAEIANICRQAGLICVKEAVAGNVASQDIEIAQDHLILAHHQCTNGLRTISPGYR